LVDKIGKVVWAAQYSAWGKAERLHVNRVDNPIRLQGQYEDGETGLYYNRYRYYDAATGQFISQDKLGITAGINFYHLGSNVFSWVDPLGWSFFRGASHGDTPSFAPRLGEYKVQDGLVQPTHGVSVFDNPNSVTSKGFDPHQIDINTVPDTLTIRQRGNDSKHFEIMPKQAMPEEEYKSALDKIKTLKKGCG